MAKVNVIVEINDYIIKEKGILNNKILRINSKNEKIEFDLEKLILIKTNNELKIKLDFKNKNIEYNLIKEKLEFNSDLIILSLTNKDKQVIINYQIESESFILRINYETIK